MIFGNVDGVALRYMKSGFIALSHTTIYAKDNLFLLDSQVAVSLSTGKLEQITLALHLFLHYH